MNELDIINLITSYLRVDNKLAPNIETSRFIINSKDKTCKKYIEGYELKSRERIYEFTRANCSMSLKLVEEF